MYTRLTGWAATVGAWRRTRSAKAAFPGALTTTLPSTPAVLRPAFTSVTRRTLESALARDRSISFCKLRTLARSPACDAVKIRCRRRRTSSSTRGQSTDPQSRLSSSGPFTTAVIPPWRPTCPSVPASLVTLPSQAHLTRFSTLSGPGSSPYPASYSGRPAEGRPWLSWFPVAFRPRAFASRVIRAPLGKWAFLAVGLPGHVAVARTPSGFPRSTRTRYDRGGCLLYPGGGAHPADKKSPTGARRFAAASP